MVLLEVSSCCTFDRKPACHENGGEACLHKSLSGSSGKCPSTHEFWKWLPMERYLLGFAAHCDVAPSETMGNPKVLSPILGEPWSKQISSSNFTALNP